MRALITEKVAVSVVFVAAMFMTIMDATIVNTALPTIGRDFHVSPTAVDGISIGFLVSLAVFIPASGWLGDRFGGRRVLMSAIVVFTAASALCGVADSLGELVVFRVLQGAGGGMMAPVGLAMLFRAFPPEERIRASSVLVVPTALAPALGPVVGGLLVTKLTWRWVFFVNLPIGLAALTFGLVFLHRSYEGDAGRFDARGFVVSALGLGLFMYGFSEGPIAGWGSARVLVALVAGLAFVVATVLVELGTPQPLIALHLLRNRLFWQGNAVITLSSVGFLGLLFAIALYYQDGRGLTALNSGLSTFPEAVGVMAGSQLASRGLYRRLGPRRLIVAACVCVGATMFALAGMGDHTSLWIARAIMFAMGLSMANVFVPVQTIAFATVSPADTGRGSTMFNAFRQLGAAIGVAALTTVIVAVGPRHLVAGHPAPNLDAYRAAFIFAGVMMLAAVVPALAIRDSEAAITMGRPASAADGSGEGVAQEPQLTA